MLINLKIFCQGEQNIDKTISGKAVSFLSYIKSIFLSVLIFFEINII